MSTKKSMSLFQATQISPMLSRLSDLAMESTARLKAVEFLVPLAIRPHLKPGPIEEGEWCLIVSNSSVAAKARQLIPAMRSHLNNQGWTITSIRLKVQTNQKLP